LGDIPIRGLKDIEGTLKKLEVEGSVLEVQELIDIYHQVALCKDLRRFFLKLETVKAPRLQEKISSLSSLKVLEKRSSKPSILKAKFSTGEPRPF